MWSQPEVTFMFSNVPRSNECVSTANSMSYQQNAHWLCYGLTNRAPQPALPFLKCLVWAGETRGQCNSWKIHRWPHREGRGRLYTNVESTRWGGGWQIDPLPKCRLALQTCWCMLHLMMQKEIPDDFEPLEKCSGVSGQQIQTELLILSAGGETGGVFYIWAGEIKRWSQKAAFLHTAKVAQHSTIRYNLRLSTQQTQSPYCASIFPQECNRIHYSLVSILVHLQHGILNFTKALKHVEPLYSSCKQRERPEVKWSTYSLILLCLS